MTETVVQLQDDWEPLRAEVQVVVDQCDGNFSAAIADSGLPYSTVHSWYLRTYRGRNDRIASDIRKWLDTRRERARNAAILPKAPGFLETESARAFLEAFSHAHHTPDLVVVTGGPGVGKTSACENYWHRNNGVLMLTGQPSIRTPRALLEDLAETLEINDRGASQRIARAVTRRLTGQPWLLIYDEAQHLTTEALDQLRTIHDISKVGICLVGNETIYPRLEGLGRTKEFAQLFSRVGMRVLRPKPLRSDVNTLLDAWEVTGERERKVLHRIALKPGALRSVTKVLRQAKMACQLDGSGTLTTQHLHDAFSRLSSTDLTAEEVA